MGEQHHGPFQLSFNRSLRIDVQGSWITSDGGLLVVRELDARVGLNELIAQHLTDSGRGQHTQVPLAALWRPSVHSRFAADEDAYDAKRLSQDPTLRLLGSTQIWERGAALTSRLPSWETERLTEEEHVAGLARIDRERLGRGEAVDSPLLSCGRGRGRTGPPTCSLVEARSRPGG